MLTALLTVAAAAQAQTTNCTYGGGQANCYSSGGVRDPYAQQATDSFNNMARFQRDQQAQFQANLRAQAQARTQQREEEAAARDQATIDSAVQQSQLRAQNAGKLIAANKCDEAKTYALNEGDLPLATQVAALCQTAAPVH